MSSSRDLFRSLALAAAWTLLVLSPSAAWQVDGDPICALANDQETPEIIPDGAGGAIMVWGDRRPYPDIFAQRVDSDGTPLWTVDGVSVCGATNAQYTPRIAPDGEGGALIAWRDNRDGNADIYVQRINSSGNAVWTADGVGACRFTATQEDPWLCSDGSGGCIVIWNDQRNGLADVYAQRIDASGNPAWAIDGVPVCTAAGIQEEARLTQADLGGAVVVWQDYRSGGDIYAQRLHSDGTSLWDVDGVPICVATGIQYTPRVIGDGMNGAIVTWQDHRTWYDIYAQRVDGDGNTLWSENGVVVCGADEWQGYPVIAESGVGGALIAWEDNRGGDWDIYTQRVDSLGMVLWADDGVAAGASPGAKTDVTLCTDGVKGGVLAWQDSRSGVGIDVFSTRIDSLGAIGWSLDGEAICLADGSQLGPRIASDGEGGAFVVWEDNRGVDSDVYAQRILGSGDVVPTMLAHSGVRVDGSAIVVEWVLSMIEPDTRFRIFRAFGNAGDFHALLGVPVLQDGLAFRFEDSSGAPGRTYRYRVEYTDNGESVILFQTRVITAPVVGLMLRQNHPNPFNPTTTISYTLPDEGHVRLTLHDAAGREIARLIDDRGTPGVHTVTWNGRDRLGRPVASGVYTCRIAAGHDQDTKKVTLIR